VLVKGGHWAGPQAIDVLASPAGELQHFQSPRVPGVDPHGTGCTYSAAMAAGLAQGYPLPKAIARAKIFMTQAIRGHLKISGHAVLRH
jgi:hydroxymethylpyrimidine/phosphomethylpyrimidine kinase